MNLIIIIVKLYINFHIISNESNESNEFAKNSDDAIKGKRWYLYKDNVWLFRHS